MVLLVWGCGIVALFGVGGSIVESGIENSCCLGLGYQRCCGWGWIEGMWKWEGGTCGVGCCGVCFVGFGWLWLS